METTTVRVVDQHSWPWDVYVRRCRVSWSLRLDGRYLIRVVWSLVPLSERP